MYLTKHCRPSAGFATCQPFINTYETVFMILRTEEGTMANMLEREMPLKDNDTMINSCQQVFLQQSQVGEGLGERLYAGESIYHLTC